MTWYQEWFGEEYLDLYSYRDEEEARHHVDFVRQHLGEIAGLVLDLASGSGRHLQELHTQGYAAVGCDLSYVLLRTGLRDYGPLDVVRADMRDLPFPAAAFDGLVNFFTSFGYFAEEAENLRVVEEMSRVIRRGAPFLFDYLNVRREIEKLVANEQRMTGGGNAVIHRWYDSSEKTLNKRITIGSKRFLERVRAYDLDEITLMFGAFDLSIHQVFGDFTGEPYGPASPRLLVVGKKQ